MAQILSAAKRAMPHTVKHPILTCAKWYWGIRHFPIQSRGDMLVFKDILGSYSSEKLKVFEWGSGASTLYYAAYLRSVGRQFEWHAMENSGFWKDQTDKRLAKTSVIDSVRVHLSEFPAFWQLPNYTPDNPVPAESYCNSKEVLSYIGMPSKLGMLFDVIFVDGRFRKRCLLAAANSLAPGGRVILHDAHKPQYHPGLEVYKDVQFMETGRMPGSRQQSTIAICKLDA